MGGLYDGLIHGWSKVWQLVGGVAQKITSVMTGARRRWRRPLVQPGAFGPADGRLPQSLASRVLYQMQTESGGNPNAINLTDINAQRGDPSRGLLQTIGSTFAAYHWPGTSWNIYDPRANIAAAVNYARHVYGPSLMSGGMGIGSGHGYDQGGWLPPGASLAVNRTGQPEYISSPGDMAAVIGELRALRRDLVAAVGRVAPATAAGVNGGATAAARRGYYSPRPA